jgi:hypothetical protein
MTPTSTARPCFGHQYISALGRSGTGAVSVGRLPSTRAWNRYGRFVYLGDRTYPAAIALAQRLYRMVPFSV